MNINGVKVLITGGRSPVALHLARMLQRIGADVFMAESEPFFLSKKSKVLAGTIQVPKPNDDVDGFIESIYTYSKKTGITFIIPTCEEIFHLAKAKEKFEESGIQLFCESIDKLHVLHNKFSFTKTLQAFGLLCPNTVQFTSLQQLKQFLQQSTGKYVLKASYSRFATNVYVIEHAQQIPNIDISEERPWILQMFIEGRQYCSYSVAIDGKLVAHTCYPTQYTAGTGANMYFQHINEPAIEQFVAHIVQQLSFTGQIAFDFIRNEDGLFYPLECNPRATSGLHLFDEDKGFPALFITGNPTSTIYPNGTTAYMLGLPMLLYGVMNGYLWKDKKQFINNYKQAKDVIYERGDVGPYLYQAVYMTALLFRKIKTKKSLTQLTTSDIEWGGE